ncbi:F-box family protein with DUF295 [Prunus dulcis]|uniref:F-box family protein with DUF295 n=1 Tax=Prunus dulcis TaxID=3755 RepID=A0A4Y1RA47_PRUDU|nr:F-box family protein with DUF295 [Prunus dulcis]
MPASVAKSVERQVLISSNRRRCPSVPEVSTAKRVRRHGVDPNRSCNEGVMLHSLEPSRPADFRERFLPTQTTVSGNTGPKRTTSLPSISPAPPQPPSATVVAGNFHETGRVRQFFENLWELVLLRFSTKSIEHQELGRSVKETSEGSKP